MKRLRTSWSVSGRSEANFDLDRSIVVAAVTDVDLGGGTVFGWDSLQLLLCPGDEFGELVRDRNTGSTNTVSQT